MADAARSAEMTTQQRQIRTALVYIHHHFREQLTLNDVAGHARLSPSYFSECFHRTTGSSFQRYLQELRLRFIVDPGNWTVKGRTYRW